MAIMERTWSFFCGQNEKYRSIVAQLVNSMATEPCTLVVGMGRVVAVYLEVNLGAITEVTLETWLSLIGLG